MWGNNYKFSLIVQCDSAHLCHKLTFKLLSSSPFKFSLFFMLNQFKSLLMTCDHSRWTLSSSWLPLPLASALLIFWAAFLLCSQVRTAVPNRHIAFYPSPELSYFSIAWIHPRLMALSYFISPFPSSKVKNRISKADWTLGPQRDWNSYQVKYDLWILYIFLSSIFLFYHFGSTCGLPFLP